jgi:hypothetical protein
MNECTQTDRQTNREGKREREKQTFQAMLLEKLLLPNKKKKELMNGLLNEGMN